MIKIQRVHIKRYRSIIDLELKLNTSNNFITICGENNTGKTNTLRAIDLFFYPEKYDRNNDAPNHKLQGSRGGATFPDITIEFLLPTGEIYKINREFYLDSLRATEAERITLSGGKKTTEKISEQEVNDLFSKIHFFFIESINISFPTLINSLIDEVYDVEYGQTTFRGLKQQLKKSFDAYTNGLLDILNNLSNEINPLFQEYRENWGVGFDLSTDVKKFRDLITNDITFYINDGSNKNIEGKGSGLQRLAFILLHARIIERIKSNKSIFLLIDEPDVYLHHGLQKKLNHRLRGLTRNSQIFITTHSPVFIDSYTLDNVFLLELLISEKHYARYDRTYKLLDTRVVNMGELDGAKKIRNYLGIDTSDYELLDKYNIVVEGGLDKFYLQELAKFFGLSLPNIIPADGADNILQYLNFYESFYRNNSTFKPSILVLLDNDMKGREVFRKIERTRSDYVEIQVKLIPNFLGESSPTENFNRVRVNHQIEDFLYPKLFCELVNRLLKRKGLKTINPSDVCAKIQKPAFKEQGILALVDNAKNEKNPDDGQTINFIGSEQASISIKQGLSKMLKIQGDKKLVEIIKEESALYPKVEEFLRFIVQAYNY